MLKLHSNQLLFMSESVSLRRLTATVFSVVLASFSVAEVRHHPQDLNKQQQFSNVEQQVKMSVVMSVQHYAKRRFNF